MLHAGMCAFVTGGSARVHVSTAAHVNYPATYLDTLAAGFLPNRGNQSDCAATLGFRGTGEILVRVRAERAHALSPPPASHPHRLEAVQCNAWTTTGLVPRLPGRGHRAPVRVMNQRSPLRVGSLSWRSVG